MEQVIFNNKIGQGFILDETDQEADYVNPIPVTINGVLIQPGEMTTMSGYFLHPVKYVGKFKSSVPELICFYLGSNTDLEGTKRFYDCYYKITEQRLFKKYAEQSGRDYNLINGIWK
jgi:hypothetical protein